MGDMSADGQVVPGARRGLVRLETPRPMAGVLMVALLVLGVIVALVGSGSSRLISARVAGPGDAELRVSGSHADLITHGLRPPPPGDVYEVWLEPPHSPALPTTVLFAVARGGSVELRLPESLSGIRQVLVTPEPAGGSLSPTAPPVLVFRVG